MVGRYMSFNGAATCSLRKAGSPYHDRRHIGPSMGPQLVRCGKRLPQTGHDRPRLPSMGPQLVRCGKSLLPPHSSQFVILQWGRNLFVAERCHIRAGARRKHPTFNGAATCSLRKATIIAGNGWKVYVLQWGRNLFVAERSSVWAYLTRMPFLQWGRNLFVAESPIPKHLAYGIYSFNGAATCSLRKGTRSRR